jgi:hypothetical protein
VNYDDFVRSKAFVDRPSGIAEPLEVSSLLKEHQVLLTRWALRRGRAAVFADTGLGKGWIILEWARVVSEYTRQPVLILAPLAVAQQFEREAAKMGGCINVCESQSDVRPSVNVTNYQKLHKFNPEAFGGVALDECFAADTLVQKLQSGSVVEVPISSIRAGDVILSAAGEDIVTDVHRREVEYAVIVRFGGREVVSSPNHPWFTQRGWVAAGELTPGDALWLSSAAVRMVRDGFHPKEQAPKERQKAEVLRQILLSEMADASTGDRGEGSQSGGCGEAWGEAFCLVQGWKSNCTQGTGANPQSESHQQPGDQEEDLPPIERDRPRSFRAWGQRAWFDRASADSSGCSWVELGSGICCVTGPTESGLSNVLQARCRAARDANRDRGGWALPFSNRAQDAGPQERLNANLVGVDGIEVLEPGDPRLERYRSPDGKLYFYDLGATRHPSFSLGGGVLVHNSSILKGLDSKSRIALIDAFRNTPFRLAATATPSPNDHTEIGGQAEFLGVMTHQEMLASFFIRDAGKTQDWRLKGHAQDLFWKWVCTWGAIVKMPSDIGCPDDGYVLPPLTYHEHIISASQEDAFRSGMLFAEPASTLTDQRTARRGSLESRVAIAAREANSSPWPTIVWCDLNAESAALTKAIPGSVEVTGSMSDEAKEAAIEAFVSGRARVCVSKPSIMGFGLNMQFARNVVFCGVSHSFEQFYQAVRRSWRFGVEGEVRAHIITSELEGKVLENLKRKMRDASHMANETRRYVAGHVREAVGGMARETLDYYPQKAFAWPTWLRTESEVA